MDISTISGLTNGISAPVNGFTSAPDPAAGEDRRVLIQAVRAVNAAELFGQQNELSFAFNRHAQKAVVRIVDRKTRELVQQIPTEQVLRLAEELKERD